jgi:hypothetical protein
MQVSWRVSSFADCSDLRPWLLLNFVWKLSSNSCNKMLRAGMQLRTGYHQFLFHGAGEHWHSRFFLIAFDLTTLSPIPPRGCKHISSPSRWRWLLHVVQVVLPPFQHPCMQRTGFASKAHQNEILRCTNCRPCTQLSDAPIRAQVLAFFTNHHSQVRCRPCGRVGLVRRAWSG